MQTKILFVSTLLISDDYVFAQYFCASRPYFFKRLAKCVILFVLFKYLQRSSLCSRQAVEMIKVAINTFDRQTLAGGYFEFVTAQF